MSGRRIAAKASVGAPPQRAPAGIIIISSLSLAFFLHAGKTVIFHPHSPIKPNQGTCTVKINWAENLRQNVHQVAESLGNLFVESFHYLALFAIGGVTAWAAVMEFLTMIEEGHLKIDDILLLFIYLELGAMVGIYFKTNHMPVRFLIYVAITALTRLLISNVSHHNPPDMGVVYLSGAILLLALAILVVRYASSQFPSVKIEHPQRKTGEGSSEHPEVEKGEI